MLGDMCGGGLGGKHLLVLSLCLDPLSPPFCTVRIYEQGEKIVSHAGSDKMCSNAAVSYTNLSPMFVPQQHIGACGQSPVCAVPASALLALDFGIQTVHD